MAHQSKFISVNLNKSYGRSSSSSSSSAFGHGRPRSGSGGGMVLLSRPRSSSSSVSKPATRLSVPPPLNLPSLRKEHERFDPASSGAAAGHGTSGMGSGSGSSAMGWSKPTLTAPSVEDAVPVAEAQSQLGRSTNNSDRFPGSAYTPPGSRLGSQILPTSPAQVLADKAVILRGEDFPSLRATALALKQKEHSSQKQKQKQIGEDQQERRAELPESRAPIEMRPQMRSSRLITYNAADADGSLNRPSGASELSQKNDSYLPGPLPLVRFQHTSDWADDERDTGLSIPERARDRGFSRFESIDSREVYEGVRDGERSSAPSGEIFKGDSFRRDVKSAVSSNRDFGSWRSPLPSRDRLSTREVGVDKDRYDSRPSSASKEVGQPPFGENGRDSYTYGNQDSRYSRRDMGSHMNTQNGKPPAETFSGRSTEQNVRGRYANPSNNWYKGNPFQNNTIVKNQLSSVNKGTSFIEPVMSFNKEKRSVPSAGKSYIEDTGFDSKDLFTGGVGDVNLKVFKKKKDVFNQSYFHDPVRESFEAELERILMTQEQERKRMMEEQARVLELARKEEEERERLAREEEDKRRLLEEEAREAAWRAEQEKLEAARRADEQRIAREEERKRYQAEEERRKEAARQKLLELEAKIARRQAEEKPNNEELPSAASADDERVPLSARERDISRHSNVRDWEDGEGIIRNIAAFVSSDTLGMNRNLDAGSRSQPSKHGNLPYVDFGNHSHYSSSLLIQDQVHHGPRSDALGFRKNTSKLSSMSTGLPSREGTSESAETFGEYHQPRQQMWNISRDDGHFRKNSDLNADLRDNEKFVEAGYGHDDSHGSPHTSFDERSLPNFEVDEFSPFTRYRQFLRQPRVPPPPSVTSMQRNSFRAPVERKNRSFVDDKARPRQSNRIDLQSSQSGYDGSYRDTVRQISVTSLEENVLHSEQMQEKSSPRCNSVSCVSVSSAPSSPAPLSHDEMDVTGDSPALPTSADGERTILSDSEHLASTMQSGTLNRMTTSSSVSPGEDDAWGTGNHDNVCRQEYYDDEEDDYQEIDEVHECADGNLDLEQKLADSHSDGQTANGEMEQVILGFDEGIEVKIPINIEIEKTSRNSDKEIVQQADHPGIENLVVHGSNTPPEVTLDDSLSVMRDTEKAMQDLVLDPITSSYPANTPEESLSPLILPQHVISPAPSIKEMTTSSTSSNVSSSANVCHGNTPVDLQFGLFSGPSLLPSPVPSIQIGSIQMPIHVHTQISPSQPPLFQFGLLRYPPPISQNMLPLPPQNMSFIPPHVPVPFSFNQNPSGFLYNQASQDSSQSKSGDAEPSRTSDKQTGLPPPFGYDQVNASLDPEKNCVDASHSQTERFFIAEQNTIDFVSCQNDGTPAKKSHKAIAGNKAYQDHQHVEFFNSQSSVGNAHTKAPGILSANQDKRHAYSGQNYSRLSLPGAEASHNVSSGFQRRARRNTHRTEFRVRESAKKRQISGMESLDNVEQDEKSKTNGRTSIISVRSFGKRNAALNMSYITELDDPNLGSSTSRVVSSDVKTFKATRKDSASKGLTPFDKSNVVKSNLNSEEDVDAPLQSGIVRVFKQPGIETPSDEDDFIEVRSKRQMLNDRREQREKENKSRSKVAKIPRKQRTSPQSNAATSNSNKTTMTLSTDASNHSHSSSLVTVKRDSSKHDPSFAFTPNTSQTLSPIGTPLPNVDREARSNDIKSNHGISYNSESNDVMNLSPTVLLENKVVAAENPASPLNSWDNGNDTRQVMALTQTQLDEAMKPAQFDSHLDSNICLEPKAISHIMSQEKPFPSCANPISSLLAGEKIQFGAVTSPTILPPANRAIANGLGPPGSSRSEVKTKQTLVTANNERVMFFGKEKHHGESFTNLEDPEAEAEAAASAVAVAAISNDEMVASGSSASTTSDSKSFNIADVTGFTSGGGTMSQAASGTSVGGESLTVALPADLSVDTPSLSLWPPLPSPQSSGPMLSHFPGAPPSHFPCFDMNSVLGGRIFAYGPNDESAVSQEQSQRSASMASGPLGAWPQCHSGVDSFYGPPTGFSGPFISPGGIPGVQGPPHMVVYNHFAPVGRFAQLGLSFMGTTYIPAGNQPEQKQNQVSSAVGEGKVDCKNGNASSQSTSPGMPAPIQHVGGGSPLMPVSGQGSTPSMAIQHLGPGSPLMPMASPLTMFDITPFQSPAGIPMQARWSHVPAPALHSVPLSIPPQQHHSEGGMSTQFNQSLSIDTSVVSNTFRDSHSSFPAGVSRDLPASSSAASRLPHELGLLEQQLSTTGSTQSVRSSFTTGSGNIKVTKSATRTTVTSMSDNGSIGVNSSTSSSQNMGTASKSKQPSSSGQQYLNSVGHLEKQGGATQKNISGGEWHRRAGFHGRNQGSGSDKSFGSSKMKQIYVAKPSTSVSSRQS